MNGATVCVDPQCILSATRVGVCRETGEGLACMSQREIMHTVRVRNYIYITGLAAQQETIETMRFLIKLLKSNLRKNNYSFSTRKLVYVIAKISLTSSTIEC